MGLAGFATTRLLLEPACRRDAPGSRLRRKRPFARPRRRHGDASIGSCLQRCARSADEVKPIGGGQKPPELQSAIPWGGGVDCQGQRAAHPDIVEQLPLVVRGDQASAVPITLLNGQLATSGSKLVARLWRKTTELDRRPVAADRADPGRLRSQLISVCVHHVNKGIAVLTNTFPRHDPRSRTLDAAPVRPTPPRRETRDGERDIARSASGSAYRGPRLRGASGGVPLWPFSARLEISRADRIRRSK
jgi:hypothetical protein